MFIWRSHRWCRPYTVPLKSKLPVASRFLRDENRVSARIIEPESFGKTVLDSGFHTVYLGFRVLVLDSVFFEMELGFQIPIVSGILDSLSCITDFTSKTSRIPGSGRHGICFAASGPR